MTQKIKVLIVDDSAFMRKVINDILSSDNDIEVVGIAKNGMDAIKMAKELSPDVITLDVEMPVMDGLTCLSELLKIDHYKVVMLSSVTKEGADYTIKALERGAVDFVTKPVNIFNITEDNKMQEIIQKVKIAFKAKRQSVSVKAKTIKKTNNFSNKQKNFDYLVALGTSTGGPRALQSVIPYLPGDINGAVVIVQHMPPGFTKSLASRLNNLSELTVKEAENNEEIRAGYAYIAPGDRHLLLKDSRGKIIIELGDSPPVSGHKPSVDAMMNTVAEIKSKKIIGVIMTGMGSDGSKGLKKIKNETGGHIIAQDEKTCVVYGMPRVAVKSNIVDEIVPLDKISKHICKAMGVRE